MFSSCIKRLLPQSFSQRILAGYHITFARLSHRHEYINEYLDHVNLKFFFNKLQKDEKFLKEYSMKNPLVEKCVRERKEIKDSLSSLLDLEKARNAEDDELRIMLNEELKETKAKLLAIECQLLDAVVPKLPTSNEVILEISAGIGGQEAMLFAKCLYEMYRGYVGYKNWYITTEDLDLSDLGGLRHASLFIQGDGVLTCLRQESGVHRVQRVPATERSGRIHTSTVSVAVLPQPKEIDVILNQKDLIIETKRASGAGGQHVNKTESAVRITHLPSGIAVECQTERSQIKNREIAFSKLYAKLYAIQQEKQITSSHLSRKQQVGTSSRSDKVRTYNFPQDRITDHRISKTMHNIPVFLQGEEMLEVLISDLILESEKSRLEQFLMSLKFISD